MLSTTTAPAPPRSRSSSRLPLLYLLFFVSGSCGLIFEIVWIRGLGLQFGTTAPAISTVLAAFMGGLALGNLLLGPVADRHARPLRLYCWLEVGIAASALAVSLLLLRGDGLFAWLASSLAESPDLKTPLRFVITSALLLLPTTLMGGTLPVIARALVRSGSAGRMLGTLYALNTAGAVAGALLPDLLLIPSVGLTATVLLAAAGNLFVAAAVGLFAMYRAYSQKGGGCPACPFASASEIAALRAEIDELRRENAALKGGVLAQA